MGVLRSVLFAQFEVVDGIVEAHAAPLCPYQWVMRPARNMWNESAMSDARVFKYASFCPAHMCFASVRALRRTPSKSMFLFSWVSACCATDLCEQDYASHPCPVGWLENDGHNFSERPQANRKHLLSFQELAAHRWCATMRQFHEMT